jgi:hypothetical protein
MGEISRSISCGSPLVRSYLKYSRSRSSPRRVGIKRPCAIVLCADSGASRPLKRGGQGSVAEIVEFAADRARLTAGTRRPGGRNRIRTFRPAETSWCGAAPVQPDFFCWASHSVEPGAHVGSARPAWPSAVRRCAPPRWVPGTACS